jgi:hypothetical protein
VLKLVNEENLFLGLDKFFKKINCSLFTSRIDSGMMKSNTYRFELVTSHIVHTIIFLNFVTVKSIDSKFLLNFIYLDNLFYE